MRAPRNVDICERLNTHSFIDTFLIAPKFDQEVLCQILYRVAAFAWWFWFPGFPGGPTPGFAWGERVCLVIGDAKIFLGPIKTPSRRDRSRRRLTKSVSEAQASITAHPRYIASLAPVATFLRRQAFVW